MRTSGTCVVACIEYNTYINHTEMHTACKISKNQKEMADLQMTWAQKLSEAEEEWQERVREERRRQEN